MSLDDGDASSRLRFVASEGGRADKVVADELGGLSRRELRELFSARLVRVDGAVAKKGHLVRAGQSVELARMPADRSPLPVEMNIEPIFLDADLVAINKPTLLPTHPLGEGERDTAANWLVFRFPECRNVGDDVREAGWVHRLDRGTSGVLIAARDRDIWLEMRARWRAGGARKRYLALVAGSLADGRSDVPLVRVGARTLPARPGESGQMSATTRWRRIANFEAASLLEVDLEGGRTHQIRAHLADAGHPICGDELYGGPPIELEGHFLHACSLAFAHPRSGRSVEISAPLPDDRARALQLLGWAKPEASNK